MKWLVWGLALSLCLAWSEPAVGQNQDFNSEEKQLRDEIQILNLLGGLYLTPDQSEFLVWKVEQAQRVKQYYLTKQSQYSGDSRQTLEKLKEEIKDETRLVSKDLARQVHQSNKLSLELRAEYQKELAGIVNEVKQNLTSTQLHIVEEFQPCLVPPDAPARFGQADNVSGLLKHLERVRNIPEDKYYNQKYDLADRLLKRVLLHRRKGEEFDQEKLRQEILDVFEQARYTDADDFNLHGEDMARKLKQTIVPRLNKIDLDTKIERFLLNPVIINILTD
ncbi:hypothetical protein ACFL1I_07130 [Candidatus Omnitrophota bacterium]